MYDPEDFSDQAALLAGIQRQRQIELQKQQISLLDQQLRAAKDTRGAESTGPHDRMQAADRNREQVQRRKKERSIEEQRELRRLAKYRFNERLAPVSKLISVSVVIFLSVLVGCLLASVEGSVVWAAAVTAASVIAYLWKVAASVRGSGWD